MPDARRFPGTESVSAMPEPAPNVKVYDRPERTGPSPILMVIALLVVLVIGFFIYKAMHKTEPAAAPTAPGVVLFTSSAWQSMQERLTN